MAIDPCAGAITSTSIGSFLKCLRTLAHSVAFAADSIPAIYAVTDDRFLVFAANAFSLLGMLALYFLLAEIMIRFRYLRPALP